MLPQATFRDLTVSKLLDATAAESRVFPSRTTPVTNAALPAVLVYTETNIAENPGEAEHQQVNVVFRNRLDLVVEAIVTGEDDDELDDNLDAIVEQVESALLKSADWVRRFTQIETYETSYRFDAESDKRRGHARMVFTVVYMTQFALN